jgi:hypothetical protein
MLHVSLLHHYSTYSLSHCHTIVGHKRSNVYIYLFRRLSKYREASYWVPVATVQWRKVAVQYFSNQEYCSLQCSFSLHSEYHC